MLISKFDLYKSEWLELVFENRNKDYGAYYLRQHYAGTMSRAMLIAFSAISALLLSATLFKSNSIANHPAAQTHDTVIHLTVTPVVPKAQHRHVKPAVVHPPARPKPPIQVKTRRYVPFVVTPDPKAVTPPKNADLPNVVIGPTDTKGKNTTESGPPFDKPAQPGTADGSADNSIHNPFGLDIMPQPVGGNAAWAKFLNKNLRFPQEARDAQVSGRVIVSFIIEKDGHLSNITILRSAGYGFDEEALRVLQLAKAWKPGMQNGQPVRVRYELPINFQLADDSE